MTHPHTDRFAGSSSDSSHRASEAVLGPFTLREAVIGGSVLLIFIGSLLPFFEANDWFGNLWNASSLFFLGIGIILPVATAGLIAARRLGTDLRIGSLSVDQFASVVAALATTFFFLQTVTSFHIGPLICLIGGIGMLAATVGGPHLPMFARDFAGRPSSNAHLMARSILPAAPKKPKTSEPVAAEQVTEFTPQPGSTAAAGASAAAAGFGAGHAGTTSQPAAQKKSPGIAGKFGFGAAAKSSSGDQGPSRPEAHLNSGVGAAAGVQDKELADADSSGYPRFADEDFAPYGTSPDSAQSPSSAKSPDAAQSPDSAQSTDGNSDAGVSSPAADQAPVDTGQQATATRKAATPESSSAATAAATTAATAAATTAATAAATTAQPVVERKSSESQDSISATKDADDDAPVVEAFWFAVGSPRPVVDEASGVELFVLLPGDWEVGIEDRGEEFLVQDKRTGRIGVMRDLTNIERAPSDG